MARNTVIVIIVLIAVVLAVFLWMAFSKQYQNNVTVVMPTTNPVVTTPMESPTGSPSGTPGTTVSPSSSPVQTSKVTINNFAFNPASMSVKVGTTVTWTNNDSTIHTITGDSSGSALKSQTLQPGDTYSFTFNQAGAFPYHCSIHPNMRGTVTVTP